MMYKSIFRYSEWKESDGVSKPRYSSLLPGIMCRPQAVCFNRGYVNQYVLQAEATVILSEK